MRIVIASTPAAGHVHPVAAIGRILINEGREVIGISGDAFRKRFEDIGAELRPLPASEVPIFQNIASFVPRAAPAIDPPRGAPYTDPPSPLGIPTRRPRNSRQFALISPQGPVAQW